jgi:glycerophosphoryl diester phosphodiesterase
MPERLVPALRALLATAALCSAAACVTDDVQVIAHRGASWDAPEHTVAAYDLALARGADWIEQDLQMTRDGQLVVLHDDSLDRTARGPAADCSGLVRDKTLAQLRRCEVGSWFNAEFPERAQPAYVGQGIPTLEDVLELYGGRARFYIETKNPAEAPGMEDSLLVLLRKHRLVGRGAREGRVMVQSFSAASLERLHALEPRLPLVQLWDDDPPAEGWAAALDRIRRYAQGFGPHRRLLNERLVALAHERGLDVHPYTVNAEAAMVFALELGVDGMFTDRPDVLARLLGR